MTIYDDEIDLRPYISALLKNWLKIGLVAFIFAAFIFGFTFLRPKVYEATATLLIPHSQLQLSIADQFRTVVDNRDSRSRMDAYLTIAQSDAIAQQTYQALAGSLSEEYTAYDLQEMIEINNQGDAILVTATAPTPELAAEIANEWAKQTVQAINLAYSGQQPLEEIQSQLEAAEATYQNAQTELEIFIETSQIVQIETTLQLTENAINAYISNQAWEIDYRYQRSQALIHLYDQLLSLKSQLENGNASNAGNAGDALAVMNARAGVSSTFNNINVQNNPNDFIFQLTDATPLLDSSTNYVRDINTLIELTDQEYLKIEQELSTETSISYSEIDASLAAEIQKLKAQLENLTARETELTSERDLAWDTYQALLQKETEIKTTSQTNAEVTFASPAIAPQQPVTKGTVMKTLIAGTLGGMIAVMWVMIRMWWESANPMNNAEPDVDPPQA